MEMRRVGGFLLAVVGVAVPAIMSAGRLRVPGPDALRLLAACAALALIGISLAVWPARLRLTSEGKAAGRERLWLYEALRYLSRDSVWAQRDASDSYWMARLEAEFVERLSLGDLVAHGRRYKPEVEQGPRPITQEFWRNVVIFGIDSIMADNSTKHSLHGRQGEAFTEIWLDRREVRRVWPRRTWLARLARQSPAERWGTARYWAQEDAKNDFLARRIKDGLAQSLDGAARG